MTTHTKAEEDTALGLKSNQSTTYTKTEVDSLVSQTAGNIYIYMYMVNEL
ncbi:MAG: hypothetical protein ACKPKO_23515 [Candidatus Fonsibacter sp.]